MHWMREMHRRNTAAAQTRHLSAVRIRERCPSPLMLPVRNRPPAPPGSVDRPRKPRIKPRETGDWPCASDQQRSNRIENAPRAGRRAGPLTPRARNAEQSCPPQASRERPVPQALPVLRKPLDPPERQAHRKHRVYPEPRALWKNKGPIGPIQANRVHAPRFTHPCG